uniref:Voltage-dependent T-type calcium channel subunit alpha-1H-like n=1 Tax=Saccoglossus kowalevskii TaxID=10224 RepID=A0ABM0LUE4_SACKO|nr:PREDICTED: voltage-dependent T-type calcium channel subunit alpha-1H-like [Saccoglossus kowalevskii]
MWLVNRVLPLSYCVLLFLVSAKYDRYVPDFYKPSPEMEYICTMPNDAGMLHCTSDLPNYRIGSTICNESAEAGLNYTDPGYNVSSCINWNKYYTTCDYSAYNPFMGAINFDNILYAWVAIFQIGAFFMINLCLVVIATQFSETKQRESKLMKEQRRKLQSSTSTLTSSSEPGGCYDEILKYIAHLVRRGRRHFSRFIKRIRGRRQRKVTPAISLSKKRRRSKSVHLHHHHHHHHHHHYHYGNVSPRAPRASPEVSDIGSSPTRPNRLMLPSMNNSLNPSHESLHSIAYCTESVSKIDSAIVNSPLCASPHAIVTTTATISIHRASSINYPSTNSKDTNASLARAKQKVENTLNNLADLSPNKLTDKLSGSCNGRNTVLNRYEKLPPIDKAKTNNLDQEKDLTNQANTTLGARLSAISPLSRTPSPCLSHYSHSPCQSFHEPSCHVHSSTKLTPCPAHVPHCHDCAEDYDDDWTDSDSDSEIDTDSDYSWGKDDVDLPEQPVGCRSRFSTFLRKIVDSKHFMRGILVAILVNTLSMGIEYHNQPIELTLVLEISNLVFTSLFALEMVLKILAYGPVMYIRNGFNVFDGIIVVLSIIEIAQDGTGGLSVLRTFRLLRILKLVRFMPALRRQLVVMLKTMDNVATFFCLLILFIFIFSILGMHLFGCKFCEYLHDGTRICDRKNFDSLLWAIVTVFQILTQEDWNVVLYNGMSKNSPWAALYFIALMTFGNYVLFNLLVAILVEGFSAEDDPKKKDSQSEIDDDSSSDEDILPKNNNKKQKVSVDKRSQSDEGVFVCLKCYESN